METSIWVELAKIFAGIINGGHFSTGGDNIKITLYC